MKENNERVTESKGWKAREEMEASEHEREDEKEMKHAEERQRDEETEKGWTDEVREEGAGVEEEKC